MAIEPGTYNFTLQRRSTHNIPLVFKDSSNNAVNLTGYTIAAQVWDEPCLNKYADFAVFSQNLITIPDDKILETKILYTIVNGKIEYQAN